MITVLYRFGRRTVYIAGQVFMAGILGVIGILGIFSGNPNVAYGIGSLMILLNFGYNISVGPLCKSSPCDTEKRLIDRLYHRRRAAQYASPTTDHCHCSNRLHLMRYRLQSARTPYAQCPSLELGRLMWMVLAGN